MDLLPEDVLAHVLHGVPPRSLAACRSVCKHWRAAVDSRGLLLASAHLLPRPPRGVFFNHAYKYDHSFFSRGGGGVPVDAALRFLPERWGCQTSRVLDHRNGLLIYRNGAAIYVCNPATRRWAALPPPPSAQQQSFYPRAHRLCLLFDPTVSLHHDVLYFPEAPARPKPSSSSPSPSSSHSWLTLSYSAPLADLPPSVRQSYERELSTVGATEWPPESYGVEAFSSRTGAWEERRFTRSQDSSAGVVAVSDVWKDQARPSSSAVCWRGKIYVHNSGGFVMRLSLPEGEYLAIKAPRLETIVRPNPHSAYGYGEHIVAYGYLGKSEHGVYYAALQGYQLRVWILREPAAGQTAPEYWELKHHADLRPCFGNGYYQGTDADSWLLDPVSEDARPPNSEWDSDDDAVDAGQAGAAGNNTGFANCYSGVDLLGYHPHKEILFLGRRFQGFAYYLGSSRMQYLGSIHPTGLRHLPSRAPTHGSSFVYTPCVDDMLHA